MISGEQTIPPKTCVFSSVGGYTKTGLLVVFYGGDELYVDSRKISGWKPLPPKISFWSKTENRKL